MSLKSYYKHFDHIPMYSEFNGKAYLSPDCSLRLKDATRQMDILPEFQMKENCLPEFETLLADLHSDQKIFCASNLLSSSQCREIIEKLDKNLPLQSIQYADIRKNKRFVVFDNIFADYLWKGIQHKFSLLMKKHNINLTPLGFSVSEGSWELCGINEAIRFNKYDSKSNDKFGIHRDAQFCPSADKRSIMSVVIYLNDDFCGGETKFHLPNNNEINMKGMNTKEEIEAHGGLKEGFQDVMITPKCGSATFFSQSILHEGLPVTSGKKFIIKTDIMVSRKPHLGFKLNPCESEDFFKCLNIFRTAQQNELNGNNDIANELYERCLSIRYSYPNSLFTSKAKVVVCEERNVKENLSDFNTSVLPISSAKSERVKMPNPYKLLPHSVWCHVANYLPEKDIISLVKVFPSLEILAYPLIERIIEPKLNYTQGIFSNFRFFYIDMFFKLNLEAYSRAICGYAIYLLGQQNDPYQMEDKKHYILNYDAKENSVTKVELKKYLTALYFEQPCFASLYKVKKLDRSQINEWHDFEQSMERNYMLLKHNKEFFGVDLGSESKCSGKMLEFKEPNNMKEKKNKKAHEKVASNSFEDLPFTTENLEVLTRKYAALYDNVTDARVVPIKRGNNGEEIPTWVYSPYEAKAISAINSRESEYIKSVYSSVSENCCGGAVIRSLDHEAMKYVKAIEFLKSRKHCYCSNLPDNMFTDSMNCILPKRTLNHLLFDFSKQKMKVSRNIPEDDVMFSHLKERVKLELQTEHKWSKTRIKKLKEFKNAFHVDISSIAESRIAFNHASCQCIFPKAELNEYVNLQSYPHLKSAYVIFEEVRPGLMNAWCCYGGIVAM